MADSAEAWRQVAATPAVLPAVQPEDTYDSAGNVSVSLDAETTRLLLGEVPAAFHAGVNDILLIAFGLAIRELFGTGGPIGIDVEGHGRHEELGAEVDLSRTVGWFTTKYPVALTVGELDWSQIASGTTSLGALVKAAKEQLRALPDPLTYGLSRYLNPDVDLNGADPVIGFNYLGRIGGAAELSEELWRVGPDGLSGGAATVVGVRLAHTLELNAVTLDTETGPRLQANWTWAPSVLDSAQVNELSRLWFEALIGICAHVHGGGGGLTPSDLAPARLSQQQINQLERHHQIGDVLPLTPLQQGLFFHASTHGDRDDVYAMQLDIALAGQLDARRLREAIRAVVIRHPHLVASFDDEFDQPVQVIPANPVMPWRCINLDGIDLEGQVEQLCAAERIAVCDLVEHSPFRAVLIYTAADRYRLVLTFHHIVVDGWSMPILLQEIFAGYYQQPLAAAVPYRRFVTWLAKRDQEAARAAWGEVLAGLDAPTLLSAADRLGLGPRGVQSFRVSPETTAALGELARAQHTTVSMVLQAAWAQLLCGLTGRQDVVFGAVVSGRPSEVTGAESMVGLLINTVPVRATLTATTTTVDLLEQLQGAYNDTVEHQHLALNEIHRIAGHDQLFDTLFVYENYPIDTSGLIDVNGLAITDIGAREHNHYPLSVQAIPGGELGLRVEYDVEVFDTGSIDAIVGRLQRVLVAMATDPARALSSIDLLDAQEQSRLDGWSNRAVLGQPPTAPVSIPDLFATQVARTPEAVALTFAGRSWTYRELDEAANRLAHLLAGQGAGPGELVALLFSRSADAVISILAVLKTGAAYLPIDPGLPNGRIAFMLDDAAPVAAITTGALTERLHEYALPVIDSNDPDIDNAPSTAVSVPVAGDVAHVMYTSGTTGAPKGVAVTHGNVLQLFDSLDVGDALTQGQVWSQCHSLAFDFSVWEIWGALLHGGRLVVVPESVTSSPEDLHALLIAEQVSVLTQTPSAVGTLAAEGLGVGHVGDRR